jgi:hypothetical protein
VYHELTETLASLEREGGNTIEVYKKSIALTAQALTQLRAHVHTHGFASIEEEIAFFKALKPKVESLHLYYRQLFELEISKSNTSGGYDAALQQQQLDRIKQFYAANAFLVKYYRSGATYLDDKLFVRLPSDGSWMPVDATHDPVFTAVCDQFIATLWAYEKLQVYINKVTQRSGIDEAYATATGKPLRWTETKAALVELIYGLQKVGCFNNGQADIKDIANLFETLFGIRLGNYYRIIQENRIRKNGPANFMERVLTALVRYMDETDLNYKG